VVSTLGQSGHIRTLLSTEYAMTRIMTPVVAHGMPVTLNRSVVFPACAPDAATSPMMFRNAGPMEAMWNLGSVLTSSVVPSENTSRASTTEVDNGSRPVNVSLVDTSVVAEREIRNDTGAGG
jgi:hypothetical protein